MNSFFHDFAARNKNLMNVLLKWNSKNSVKLQEISKFCQNMLDQKKMKTTKKHLTSKNVNFEGKYWVNGVIWFKKKNIKNLKKESKVMSFSKSKQVKTARGNRQFKRILNLFQWISFLRTSMINKMFESFLKWISNYSIVQKTSNSTMEFPSYTFRIFRIFSAHFLIFSTF